MKAYIAIAEETAAVLHGVSEFIHSHPEPGFEEFKAAERIKTFLEEHGFEVEDNAGGLPTALKAFRRSRNAENAPVFCFMGEYDALAVMGHGCGHNLIAVSALTAAYVAAEYAQRNGIDANICFAGTPAEEGGGGKVKMVEAGAFDGIDAALIAHPFDRTTPDLGGLSVARAYITFRGRASHAAFAPEEGINALDTMVEFYNGILEWKKHITDRERVHGIITKGGDAANIIPDHTEAFFYVRAPGEPEIQLLKTKLEELAKNVAGKTGCTYDVNWVSAYKGLIFNKPFNDEYIAAWGELGEKLVLTDGTEGRGSTDTGDVSQIMPCAHFYFGITDGKSVPLHTIDFREAAATDGAFRQALLTGAVMARIAIRYFADSAFCESVHKNYQN